MFLNAEMEGGNKETGNRKRKEKKEKKDIERGETKHDERESKESKRSENNNKSVQKLLKLLKSTLRVPVGWSRQKWYQSFCGVLVNKLESKNLSIEWFKSITNIFI